MSNIKFIKPNSDMIYNPDKRIDTFYQICKFKNVNKMHEVRKIFFNQLGNVLKTSEKQYDANKIKSFIKTYGQNKYKIYSVSSLSYLETANANDMTEVQSELLNNNCVEYGNQKVENY
jgi:hypothetical protein